MTYLFNRFEHPAAILPDQIIDFICLDAGQVRAGIVFIAVFGALVVAYGLRYTHKPSDRHE